MQSSSGKTPLTKGAKKSSSQTEGSWETLGGMWGPEQIGSKVQEGAPLSTDWEAQARTVNCGEETTDNSMKGVQTPRD